VIHPDGTVSKTSYGFQIMRNENDRHTLMFELLNPANAALLKEKIADRQRFVHDQDVGIHMNRHSESEPDEHATGIGFYRAIDEISYFRKLFNRRYALSGLCIGKTENGRVQENVFAPGELRIKPSASSLVRTRGNRLNIPDVGRITPAIILNSVPEPFSPMIPKAAPPAIQVRHSLPRRVHGIAVCRREVLLVVGGRR
jgi:hypothetical protein